MRKGKPHSELQQPGVRRSTRRKASNAAAGSALTESGKSDRNIALTLKHYHRHEESSGAMSSKKRTYLNVGDEVNHLHYEEWGLGVVMEVMTSSVPGGTCLARVRFQDGQLRCFNNDLDNQTCCYYFGLRRQWNPTHGVDAIRSKLFMRG